jgi:hypothetical protein
MHLVIKNILYFLLSLTMASYGNSQQNINANIGKTLKNCTINEAYFEKKIKSTKQLTNNEIKSLNLTIIKDINSDTYAKIKVIDTIFANQDTKFIIVAKESENESTAYLVQLDKSNKAVAFWLVYYADFVEYISTTNTTISDKLITIITKTENFESGKQIIKTKSLKFKNGKLSK